MLLIDENHEKGASPIQKTMRIYPQAELFPMMSSEELAEFAEDIKANGLHQPIITTHDDQLLDGLIRYTACRLAGVEPRFEKLNGQDPVDYLVSANLRRRHLTKSQQAMILAILYGGSGVTSTRWAFSLRCSGAWPVV